MKHLCKLCGECQYQTLSAVEADTVRWLHMSLYSRGLNAFGEFVWLPNPERDDPEWQRTANGVVTDALADLAPVWVSTNQAVAA